MGYNARNDEIRDNVTRMRWEWEAQRNALATVRRFNATLSAKGYVWFWPKIAAALTAKHHWLIIACDSCDTVVDLDLRVKPTRRLPCALRCATCAARAATGMAAHASSGASPVDLTLRLLAERRSNYLRQCRDTQSNWVPLSSCSQMQYPLGEESLT
jgi:hypothetical protein